MVKVDNYEIPEGLYYSKDWACIKVEGNKVRCGISDYAQKQVASGKISQGHAKVLVGLDEKNQKIIRTRNFFVDNYTSSNIRTCVGR